ncbi:MAG: hypothetical protein WA628_06430 [Terriglobales bacterium]
MYSDPRTGNITTGEPGPALFQVPADYTIVDEKDKFTMRFGTP